MEGSMKITPTMLRILKAVEENPGCGANYVDSFLFPDKRMPLRTGQYMGKLRVRGLIHRRFDEHRGKRGNVYAMTVCYTLTPFAREILKRLKPDNPTEVMNLIMPNGVNHDKKQ
jgi:hypothetical protein